MGNDLPLGAHRLAVALHAIVIVDVATAAARMTHLGGPAVAVEGHHLVLSIEEIVGAVDNMQHNFLAKDGLVIEIELKFHTILRFLIYIIF